MKTIKRKISRVFSSGGSSGGTGNAEPATEANVLATTAAATAQKEGGNADANCCCCGNGHLHGQQQTMANPKQQQHWRSNGSNNQHQLGPADERLSTSCQFFPGNNGAIVASRNGNAEWECNLSCSNPQPNGFVPQMGTAASAQTKSRYRWSLSDSLSLLGERIAEMTVHEEATTTTAEVAMGGGRAGQNHERHYNKYNNNNNGNCGVPMPNNNNNEAHTNNGIPVPNNNMPSSNSNSSSHYYENNSACSNANGGGIIEQQQNGERPPLVLMRANNNNKKKGRQQYGQQQKTKSWHASRWFGNFGASSAHHSTVPTTTTMAMPPAPPASAQQSSMPTPIANNNNKQLGSEGESVEVSQSTTASSSDQQQHPHSSSACSSSNQSSGGTTEGAAAYEYVPNVKMRQKPTKLERRRWSEEEIQKRLSLPAYISIPPSVIDKLNRTTAAMPSSSDEFANSTLLMSRKSRRASLTEIGFGRLETYKKILDLGSGTYAKVFLGQSMLTGRSVALKEIRLEHEEGAPCTAIREVSLLRNLRHANIVTLHDVVHTDSVLTLVFEFVEQDLREYMEELEGPISIGNVKLFLVQLLRGLAYCHARRILHRDLKPQNLLITKGGELKLADFGLARAQSVPIKTYSAEVVTLWYRPPDLLLGSTDYTAHIDMWAVGCILYEMLNHRPMFPGTTPTEQLELIFQKLGTPRPDTHPEMCTLPGYRRMRRRSWPPQAAKSLLNLPRMNRERVDLLLKLLKYDGKQRISAECAMRHPFLGCFPPALFKLADTASVFTLPNIEFVPDKKHSPFMMIMGTAVPIAKGIPVSWAYNEVMAADNNR